LDLEGIFSPCKQDEWKEEKEKRLSPWLKNDPIFNDEKVSLKENLFPN